MYLFGHSFPNCATNLQKLPESRKFFATFFAASHLITPWKGEFRSAAEARRYGKADSAPPPSRGEKICRGGFRSAALEGRKIWRGGFRSAALEGKKIWRGGFRSAAIEGRKIWKGGFRSAALAIIRVFMVCVQGGFGFGGGSESAFPYASRPRNGRPHHGARHLSCSCVYNNVIILFAITSAIPPFHMLRA